MANIHNNSENNNMENQSKNKNNRTEQNDRNLGKMHDCLKQIFVQLTEDIIKQLRKFAPKVSTTELRC